MSFRIEKELSELYKILSDPGIKENRSPADEKIIQRALKTIADLQTKGVSKLTDKEINLFHHLDESLRFEKVSILLEKIFTAGNEKKEPSVKIGLKVAFYCDVDSTDHNGAINKRILYAVDQKIPFITTRSLLRVKKEKTPISSVVLRLARSKEDWVVFKKGEFVLFLPKTLHPDLMTNPEKALKELDFAFDGSLTPITIDEALYEPESPPDFKDLTTLFSPEPHLQKLFYFAGHGGTDVVGALNSDHYRQFLTFLETQQCRGLTISSCSAGGKSSLLSHREEEGHFDDPKADHRFPIIVRSIGDFPTRLQEAEFDLGGYFNELTYFLEEKATTVSNLRQTLQNVEFRASKAPSNLVKVYFPHPKGVPGGFRPIDENSRGFSLTITVVRGQKLRFNAWRSHDPENSDEPNPLLASSPTLQIRDKRYLEVHPLVTNIPLQFVGQNPIALSMTPGNSHHLMQSIELYDTPPMAYLNQMIEFYQTNEGGALKGFLIGKLSHRADQLQEVALFLSPRGSFVVYRQKNEYFFSDGIFPIKISPFEHAIYFKQIVDWTSPIEEAVLASSGGQESEKLFREEVMSSSFWSTKKTDGRVAILEGRFDLLPNEGLGMRERTTLLVHLLKYGENEQAHNFLKKGPVDPNIKDLRGYTPLFIAATSPMPLLPLIDDLLKLGGDVNIRAKKTDLFLIDYIVMIGNPELTQRFFDHPDLVLDHPLTSSGIDNPIFEANDQKTIDLLKSKGVDINRVTKNGLTPLSLAMKEESEEKIDLFLANGADPNLDRPPPSPSLVEAPILTW